MNSILVTLVVMLQVFVIAAVLVISMIRANGFAKGKLAYRVIALPVILLLLSTFTIIGTLQNPENIGFWGQFIIVGLTVSGVVMYFNLMKVIPVLHKSPAASNDAGDASST